MRVVDEILKQRGVCAPVLFGDLKVRMRDCGFVLVFDGTLTALTFCDR